MLKNSPVKIGARPWPLLLFLLFSQTVLADTYRVGVRTAKDGEQAYSYSVVFPQVLDAIAEITSDEFEYIRLPPSRVKKYFNEGKIHIEPGTNPIWRRKEAVPGLFSTPFSSNATILLFKAGKRQSFEMTRGKQPLTIGTVRGFSYPTLETQIDQGWLKRYDMVDESRLLIAIIDGRLEQAAVSLPFAEIWMNNNARQKDYEFGEIIEKQPVMMRLHPTARSLLPRMNKAIEQLVKSGKMKELTGIDVMQ